MRSLCFAPVCKLNRNAHRSASVIARSKSTYGRTSKFRFWQLFGLGGADRRRPVRLTPEQCLLTGTFVAIRELFRQSNRQVRPVK
jgi:hypothetical protein